MRQIHSLPEPKELGFRWRPFEKARKKLDHVERKRREVQKRETELKARIKRKQGEAILGMFEEDAKRRQGADPLLEALSRAWRAKASEAEADKQ